MAHFTSFLATRRLATVCVFATVAIAPNHALSQSQAPEQATSQLADSAQAQESVEPVAAPALVPGSPLQSTVLPARLSDVEGEVRVSQSTSHPLVEQAPNQKQVQPSKETPLHKSRLSSQGVSPDQVPPPPADEVFRQALVNMPVLPGMQVDTGADGRAELQFNDGSMVRLTPNSTVAVLVIENGGEQLHALRGISYYETPEGSAGVLTVQAGPDQVRVALNSLVRADLDNAPYQLGILRGSAHFNNQASDVGFEASAGQTATLDPSAPNAYDIKQDLASNSWDDWNNDRDATLAELAQNETNARIGNGDSASEAWNDLDYYGTWYNVPGAGMAWAPDGVDASFDPYGAGAWGNYSGVGLLWVSSYPWGWLPYHCGGWSHFNSFGWLWQPGGGCGGFGGAGWYPYTGLHNAPHGYRLPLRPFDPRLRTHLGGVPLPRSQPLAPVLRGPTLHFRQIGGIKPEPRPFPLDKTASLEGGSNFAPTLPVMNTGLRSQYGLQPGYGFTGNTGGGVQAQHIERGRATFPTTGSGVILSSPRIVPAPVHIAPAPVPHYAAPAPPVSVSSPRFSAPAPAPAPVPAPAPRAH